jgi:hypothetical protein
MRIPFVPDLPRRKKTANPAGDTQVVAWTPDSKYIIYVGDDNCIYSAHVGGSWARLYQPEAGNGVWGLSAVRDRSDLVLDPSGRSYNGNWVIFFVLDNGHGGLPMMIRMPNSTPAAEQVFDQDKLRDLQVSEEWILRATWPQTRWFEPSGTYTPAGATPPPRGDG